MFSRQEFDARIETIETRMDARVANIETIEARMDARVANIENKIDQYIAFSAERDAERALQDREKEASRNLRDREKEASRALLDQQREKRLEERDRRLEKLAESAEGLKSTIWLAAVTTMVTVALAFFGTAISSFYATQSSNLAIVQATISAFQQGQNTPQIMSIK